MGNNKSIILLETEDFLFVNKPANELVIPDRFSDEKSLQAKLTRKFGKLWVVHRLDRDTSGVVCFAKNENAHKYLSSLFLERLVEKIYLAITDMAPHNDKGLIDIGIRESQRTKGLMKAHEKGKPSQTRYEVIERFGIASLMKLELLTGRTHQIRVHLRHIGHPLLVDKKYGNRESFLLSSLKGRKFQLAKNMQERPLMNRQSLHASSLSFVTENNEKIFVEAPLPKDMKAVLNQLRKHTS